MIILLILPRHVKKNHTNMGPTRFFLVYRVLLERHEKLDISLQTYTT